MFINVKVRGILHMLEDPFNPAYSYFRTNTSAPCMQNHIYSNTDVDMDIDAASQALVQAYCPSQGDQGYASTPEWAADLICTCSS